MTNKEKKGQKGFSLIELVIVIALTGLITAAITMTIFQVFNMNTRTANRMTAVSQVQHVGKALHEDVPQARSVNATAGSGHLLTLICPDYETVEGVLQPVDRKIVYKLMTMPSVPSAGLMRLEREYYNYSDDAAANSTVVVAEYILETSCECNPGGGDWKTLTVSITFKVGDETETGRYKIDRRVE